MEIDFKFLISKAKNKEYKYLGRGSGREVYDLGNGYVIKIGFNKKGLAQNEVEYKIGRETDNKIFARIIKIEENYKCLIMEKAEKVRSIRIIWQYFNVKSNSELAKLSVLKKLSEEYGLLLGDFKRHNNWGIIRGQPVIIDYGFTKDVYKKYYKKR